MNSPVLPVVRGDLLLNSKLRPGAQEQDLPAVARARQAEGEMVGFRNRVDVSRANLKRPFFELVLSGSSSLHRFDSCNLYRIILQSVQNNLGLVYSVGVAG